MEVWADQYARHSQTLAPKLQVTWRHEMTMYTRIVIEATRYSSGAQAIVIFGNGGLKLVKVTFLQRCHSLTGHD